MRIAIIPTTGGTDPFRGMQAAVELGVEGVHIGAYGGALDLEHKTTAGRPFSTVSAAQATVSALIGWERQSRLWRRRRTGGRTSSGASA